MTYILYTVWYFVVYTFILLYAMFIGSKSFSKQSEHMSGLHSSEDTFISNIVVYCCVKYYIYRATAAENRAARERGNIQYSHLTTPHMMSLLAELVLLIGQTSHLATLKYCQGLRNLLKY